MNWGNSSDADFWGILDSFEKPWFSEHENNRHIQSHFIVFNRNEYSLVIENPTNDLI